MGVPGSLACRQGSPPRAQLRQGFRFETQQFAAASHQFVQRQATVPATLQVRHQCRSQQQGNRRRRRQRMAFGWKLRRQRGDEPRKRDIQTPQPTALPPSIETSQHRVRFHAKPRRHHDALPTAGRRRSSAASTSQGGAMVAQPFAGPEEPRRNKYTAPPNCSCGRYAAPNRACSCRCKAKR